MLNLDLHSHSIFSDGTLAPEDLVARAARRGVEVLALTDHDGTGGLAAARATAAAYGVRLIDGVEISVTWRGHTIHIVGLGIDPADRALQAGLAATRGGRVGRVRKMAAALEVVSSRHKPHQYATFAAHARQFGLAASAGSDFHSPEESYHDLGSLPALPAGLTPVWEVFSV